MIAGAIGLMGQARSGRVMSLVGMGMYGAFAAGGPIGFELTDRRQGCGSDRVVRLDGRDASDTSPSA